ncbi:hypothetical protein BHS07_09085 [Myxococcus xanthus]|nr:hypothetical protein BHS07_09085 [Myxococcus xanthus]
MPDAAKEQELELPPYLRQRPTRHAPGERPMESEEAMSHHAEGGVVMDAHQQVGLLAHQQTFASIDEWRADEWNA